MARRRYPKISQGTDGLWHAWVVVGTKTNGRPDQRHVKRATAEEVEERVDELLDQKKAGQVVKAGRGVSVAAWLDTYLTDVAPRRCDPTTVQGYASKMRLYVLPVIGKTRLDRLKPDQLDRVYVEMQRAGRAEATILQVHRILSRALEVAYRRGMMPRNPAKLIDAPTAKRQEIKPLTEDEAVKVLAAAAGSRNAARWSVGLALGLRQGEALGLRWSYVDLDAGEIRVWWQLHRRAHEHGCGTPPTCGRRRAGNCPERTLRLRSGEQHLGGGLLLKEPKGKGKRTVPIPPELVAALKAHREVQQLERMVAEDSYAKHDLVFADVNGSPVDPARDWDAWHALLKSAGVRRARVHDGRHTAATLLLAQGVGLRVVQEILGHSSVTVTQGYAHVASAMARDATQRMGSSLLKKPGTP
ncbi:tyrosine-type recombinase/integrase [Micromonospora marina]|uniref:tyrosine-type recombinase/integrase n=1 Tax=Micromonospora marina TaxID=307120 RepID=UPI003455DBF9